MIARGFVEAGAKVYISSRKADVCDEVAAELSENGECISLPADLSTEDECRRLAGEVASREDKLHILVNNAGATWGAPLAEHDDADVGPGAPINVKGVFHLTKFCLPLLEGGRHRRRPRARHQHRLDRRHPGADAGDVLVLVEQGRGAPAHPPPRRASSRPRSR